MLDDGFCARQQINKFLELQTELPAFTTQDWLRLTEIHKVLSKFNELTFLVVPIYYELHDFLHDASESKNGFYNKYYSFMDESEMYYTALVLDPRVKGNLILEELREDNNSGKLILQAICRNLHR
ncbi:hypothetical protein V1527DRAFT_467268, partial [Lipomyces starkeyi]